MCARSQPQQQQKMQEEQNAKAATKQVAAAALQQLASTISPTTADSKTQCVSHSKYERLEKLGEGAYGVVYKGRHRETGEVVAMKRIRYEGPDDGLPATAMREITLLQKIQSNYVVHLNEVIHEDHRLCLIFEFLSQDLKMYMDSIGSEGMHPKIFLSFAEQMMRGLAEVHAHSVLHRDLKPQNLLIDSRGSLKLADFGLARGFKAPIHRFTHEIVTLWYRAPCILMGSDAYSTGVDIWAAACIIAEMSNLAPLFAGESEIDQLLKIFRNLGTPSEDTWKGVSRFVDYNPCFPQWRAKPLQQALPKMSSAGVDLISRMLCYPPTQRLTAKQALAHEFFAKPQQRDAV